MCAERRLVRRRQRGMSLVEIMVGMVVALLIGLAASGSARVFTASQRQGLSSGGMTVNAATSLSAIKGEVANAGLGFLGDSTFLCGTLQLSVGGTILSNGANFVPLRITRNSSTNNDTIDVVYATNIAAGANVLLQTDSNGASTMLQSVLPAVQVGDAVLLSPQPSAGTGNCLVRTVTASSAPVPPAGQVLTFGASGLHNQATFAATPSFAIGDRTALLGTLRWTRLSLNGTDLRMDRLVSGDSAVIVRNVLAFRAQYGVAADAASTTPSWVDPTGGTWGTLAPANVDRVRGVRIAMLTRSTQPDKPTTPGDPSTCTATTALPTLYGQTVTADVSDWKCYRYRISEVVVPLRNLVW